MIHLLLEPKTVYPWMQKDRQHIRGWYERDGVLYDQENPENPWTDCDTPERFSSRLNAMKGNYSVILETDACLFAAVDRITSYPLYYTRDAENALCVSDSLQAIKKARPCVINRQAREELLDCGFVLGRRTIYQDVFQLQGGQMLVYEKDTGRLQVEDYFLHTHSRVSQKSPEELCEELDRVTLRVFQRMVRSIHGKTIALFLSGGYDSRLVASTLKRLGYPKVICITMGGKSTLDAVVAQEVANQLGFPLIKVNADKAYWKNLRASGYLDEAFDKLASHCAMPYFQGIVLRDLIRSGQLPRDCVAVTGNSGDAIEGNDVTHKFFPGTLYSSREIADAICFTHFMLNGRKEAQKLLERFDLTPYSAVCGKKEGFSDEEAEEIVEFFSWRERQCKYVANDIRNYDDCMGIEWRLPLWDHEFVDFWLSVPYHLRYDRNLYYQYVHHEQLPTANNPSLWRNGINWLKKRTGKLLLPLYPPKALWNYFFSSHFSFSTYGLLTFPELCEILRTNKGYRETQSQGRVRLFLKHL